MATSDAALSSVLGGPDLQELRGLARRVRRTIVELAAVKPLHVASSLSLTELLVSLYFHRPRIGPLEIERADRDRVILSKGHGATALYAVLYERGILPGSILRCFGEAGCPLAGHPVDGVKGVEVATGALGHGLSIGAGMALAARMNGARWRTLVVMGDGELNEGSVWEAAMFSAHHGLHNLVAIVDRNRMQQSGTTSAVLETEPLQDKWRAFGWQVLPVPGHDLAAICAALDQCWLGDAQRPTVLLAETVKGKGVSFIERDLQWHMARLGEEDLRRALRELELEQ